jgi:hypothetical protein
MGRIESHEANVRRLYPKLIEIVEGVELADAGCALCTALTILAFREGYSLEGLLWLTNGSIERGWRDLNKWGLPREAFPSTTNNKKEGNNG